MANEFVARKGIISIGNIVMINTGHTLTLQNHSAGVNFHSTGNIAPHYQTNFALYTGEIGSGTQRFIIDSSGFATFAGDIALRNRITIGGSSGAATTGAGFWTDYIAGGKTSLGALTSGNGYGIFYYQGGAGRDGNDSIDFAFNTTTAATSVMSVKTNGEVKISGAVTATNFIGSINGYPTSTAAGANTIVVRDGNGFIFGSYINSSRGEENTAAASYIYDNSDGWMRKKSLANTRLEIVTSAAVIAGLGYTPTSGGVTGTGTTNYITKWTGTTTIGHCNNIYADATNVSIGGPNSITLSATYVSIGQSVSMNLSIGQGGGGSMSCFIPTYIYSTLYVSGDVVSYYSSDKRLKDNITKISNALEKISKIGGYSFDWNDKQKIYHGPDIGVIAQEIETVLPEIVTTRSNGYKAVNYEKIVALLIEGIKEQQIQIDKLNSKLLI